MGRRGHERLVRDNAPDAHYSKLMAIYEAARAPRSAA
jgi:hypothetical protein